MLKILTVIAYLANLSACKKTERPEGPPSQDALTVEGLGLAYEKINPNDITLKIDGPAPALLFEDWFPGFRFNTEKGAVPDRILYEACFEDPQCLGDPIVGMYNTSSFIVPVPLEGDWYIRFRPCLHADRSATGKEECSRDPTETFKWTQSSLASDETYELAKFVGDLHWNYQEIGIKAHATMTSLSNELESCPLASQDERARLKLISELGPDYLTMSFWRNGFPKAEEIAGLGLAEGGGGSARALPSYDFTRGELVVLSRRLSQLERALPPISRPTSPAVGGGSPPPPPPPGGVGGGMQRVSPGDLIKLDPVFASEGKQMKFTAVNEYRVGISRQGPRYEFELTRADGVKLKFESKPNDNKLKCFIWDEGQWKPATPQYWTKGKPPEKTTKIAVAKTSSPPAIGRAVASVAGGVDFNRQLAFSGFDDAMKRLSSADLNAPVRIDEAEAVLERWSSLAGDFRGNKIARDFGNEMAAIGTSSSRDFSTGIGKQFEDALRPLERHVSADSLSRFLATDLSGMSDLQLKEFAQTLQRRLDVLDTLGVPDDVKTAMNERAQNVLEILTDSKTAKAQRVAGANEFLQEMRTQIPFADYKINQERLDSIRTELASLRTDVAAGWTPVRQKADEQGLLQKRGRPTTAITPATLVASVETAPLRAGSSELARVFPTTPALSEISEDETIRSDTPSPGPETRPSVVTPPTEMEPVRLGEADVPGRGLGGSWQPASPVPRMRAAGTCDQEQGRWRSGLYAALGWMAVGATIATCVAARMMLTEEGDNCNARALEPFKKAWGSLETEEALFAPYRTELTKAVF